MKDLVIEDGTTNATSAELTGTIHWFSEQKGYGFIELAGQKDVFVHISQVELAEYTASDMRNDRKIHFMLGTSRDGKKMAINLRLEAEAKPTLITGKLSVTPGVTGRLEGTVAWTHPQNGFGFIKRDGQKDVFLHVRQLQKAGIDAATIDGKTVTFKTVPGRDGREAAVDVRLK